MSAIAENPEGPHEVIQVLFALFPNFGALDFTGPLEVLNYATHTVGDVGKQNPLVICSFMSVTAHKVANPPLAAAAAATGKDMRDNTQLTPPDLQVAKLSNAPSSALRQP